MTEENAPVAPDSLPKYLREGMKKQDVETLHDVIEHAEQLIEFQQRPIDIETEVDGEVESVEKTDDQGTIVTRYNTCGDDSCRCADGDLHGPYKYRAYRNEKGTVVTEYIGKADA